jgi:ABC-type maltose transport system permease subunit
VIEQAVVLLKRSDLQPLSIYLSQIADQNLDVFFATSCLYLMPIFLIFLLTGKTFRFNITSNKTVSRKRLVERLRGAK